MDMFECIVTAQSFGDAGAALHVHPVVGEVQVGERVVGLQGRSHRFCPVRGKAVHGQIQSHYSIISLL